LITNGKQLNVARQFQMQPFDESIHFECTVSDSYHDYNMFNCLCGFDTPDSDQANL
jgi:hypothetical protein